jgi:hypothetical protein
MLGERVTSRFDEVAIGNNRWAGRFTTETLDTGVECLGYFSSQWRIMKLDLPHECNSASGRKRFISGDSISRTGREAESALHTRTKLIGIDSKVHQNALLPGLSRPVGSKLFFIRVEISITLGESAGRG